MLGSFGKKAIKATLLLSGLIKKGGINENNIGESKVLSLPI